ncbi:Geranylgeranyl diphosphate synthase [Burkholderiales bacterium 8X]|nr:Geranylgeranyl diphosphate synthase [Burkholderiales bacterium 8X]
MNIAALPRRDAPPGRRASLKELHASIERRLAQLLPMPRDADDLVSLAMREAVLGPGKRVRPLLMLATAQGFGLHSSDVMDAACAVEMVHAASLLLDDLPCMDDALERRGRPAMHLRFGEDIALLASVALLSQAYGVVAAAEDMAPLLRARVVGVLAEAVGTAGLVRGQYRDLREDQANADEKALTGINDLKTGSLFKVSLVVPGLAAQAEEALLQRLAACAGEIGRAFQLRDDLDDGADLPPTSSATPSDGFGSGEDEGKATLVALLGRRAARERFDSCLQKAERCLIEIFPNDQTLLQLVRRIAPEPAPSQLDDCDGWTPASQAAPTLLARTSA